MYGFSVLFKPFDLKFNAEIKSEYVHIQKVKPLGWFENNGVEKTDKIVLYKKVSSEFKTQEGSSNETLWTIGSTLEHKDWNPKGQECGEGKFHACSRPYFCDEYRNGKGDRYIAIEIATEDTYEWPNPNHPHKIAFRKGTVLYECDRFGKQK